MMSDTAPGEDSDEPATPRLLETTVPDPRRVAAEAAAAQFLAPSPAGARSGPARGPARAGPAATGLSGGGGVLVGAVEAALAGPLLALASRLAALEAAASEVPGLPAVEEQAPPSAALGASGLLFGGPSAGPLSSRDAAVAQVRALVPPLPAARGLPPPAFPPGAALGRPAAAFSAWPAGGGGGAALEAFDAGAPPVEDVGTRLVSWLESRAGDDLGAGDTHDAVRYEAQCLHRPKETADAWELLCRKQLNLRASMPFSPKLVAERPGGPDWSKMKTLRRWWDVNAQVWEAVNGPEAEQNPARALQLARMYVVQTFKGLDQAALDGANWGAAWGHTFLPPVGVHTTVGASAAEQRRVAQGVTARAKLAKALKEAKETPGPGAQTPG